MENKEESIDKLQSFKEKLKDDVFLSDLIIDYNRLIYQNEIYIDALLKLLDDNEGVCVKKHDFHMLIYKKSDIIMIDNVPEFYKHMTIDDTVNAKIILTYGGIH